MKHPDSKGNCKELILDAAEFVVMEVGAAHMSLDVVAKKAGISKGGLLYHFPGKADLLKAMLNRMVAEFFQERENNLKNFPEGKGRFLKAGVASVLDCNARKERMRLSLLVATAEALDLLDPVRQGYKDYFDQLQASGLPFERAAVVALASDGLMFNELFKIAPFTSVQRKRIKNEMIKMIDEMESGKK